VELIAYDMVTPVMRSIVKKTILLQAPFEGLPIAARSVPEGVK
jgi:hypothetical protein